MELYTRVGLAPPDLNRKEKLASISFYHCFGGSFPEELNLLLSEPPFQIPGVMNSGFLGSPLASAAQVKQ